MYKSKSRKILFLGKNPENLRDRQNLRLDCREVFLEGSVAAAFRDERFPQRNERQARRLSSVSRQRLLPYAVLGDLSERRHERKLCSSYIRGWYHRRGCFSTWFARYSRHLSSPSWFSRDI